MHSAKSVSNTVRYLLLSLLLLLLLFFVFCLYVNVFVAVRRVHGGSTQFSCTPTMPVSSPRSVQWY